MENGTSHVVSSVHKYYAPVEFCMRIRAGRGSQDKRMRRGYTHRKRAENRGCRAQPGSKGETAAIWQSSGFSRESVRISRARAISVASVRCCVSDNARINVRELISPFCNSRFCERIWTYFCFLFPSAQLS